MPCLLRQLRTIHSVRWPMRRGFTLVELCFGLVITSLVMGAVAAFTLAMAQSWKHSDQMERAALRGRHATLRLARLVQHGRLIGAVEQGALDNPTAPAAVLVWVEDTNRDGAIQGAECAMVEHDPARQLLLLYPSGQGDATTVLPWATFTSPAVLSNFKVGRDARPIARGVEAVRFAAHATTGTTQNPTLEYTMKLAAVGSNAGQIDHNGRSRLEYGTVVVRAPAKPPA